MYLRTVSLDTTVTNCLLTAKSKLTPIKKQTIPRLELCGAQVLSKLLFQSAKDLGIPMNSVYAWSDSAVVLGWMKTSPGKLKTYVFHRVQDTINRIPFSNWRYVNTIHNPADSVGVSPKELLKNKLWWEGPTWLSQLPAWWPRRPDIDRETAPTNSSLLSPLVLAHQVQLLFLQKVMPCYSMDSKISQQNSNEAENSSGRISDY